MRAVFDLVAPLKPRGGRFGNGGREHLALRMSRSVRPDAYTPANGFCIMAELQGIAQLPVR